MNLLTLSEQVRFTLPDTLKQRLAGGALCVLILAGIYMSEILMPSSHQSLVHSILSMVCQTVLFAMALCWTYRESNTPLLMGRLINLQVVAALIWIVASEISPVPLSEAAGQVRLEKNEVWLQLLAVAVCGIIFYVAIRKVTKNKKCDNVKKNTVETSPEEQLFVRMMDGKKISSELNELETPLANHCCSIDQPLSNWLKNMRHPLSSKEILICFLIRRGKTSKEIQESLTTTYDTYRKTISRIAEKAGIKLSKRGGVLEQFLRSLH